MRSVFVVSLASIAFALACSTEAPPEGTSGTAEPTGGDGPTAGTTTPGGGDGGSATPPWSTAPKTGIATYYDADGTGNCSFDATPNDLDVAALSLATDYAGSAMCGACIEVTGEKGTVVVRAVDSCPGCDAGHLDLSREAFAKIDDLKDGRVPITWRFVACPVTGAMSYRFKEGSSKFWTAIQVRNHKVPIAKLEFQKSGAFVEMTRQSYNYFVASKGVGDQPAGITLRITSVDGQVRTDTVPKVLDGATAPGTAQFD